MNIWQLVTILIGGMIGGSVPASFKYLVGFTAGIICGFLTNKNIK
jgi:hypothetical protein